MPESLVFRAFLFYYLNKLSPKEEDQLLFEEIQNFNYNQSAIFGLEPDIMCGHASIYRPNTLSNALGHISVTGTFSIVSNITNNSDIVINAGAEIELRPGFYVGKGCDVYLNTLFLDCNNTYSSISYAPQYENNKRDEIIIEDNIDIIAKEITGIAITSEPSKKQYIQNYEALNLAGAKITVTYTDGTTDEIMQSSISSGDIW